MRIKSNPWSKKYYRVCFLYCSNVFLPSYDNMKCTHIFFNAQCTYSNITYPKGHYDQMYQKIESIRVKKAFVCTFVHVTVLLWCPEAYISIF